jgi:hypothetical protein
MFFYAGVNDGPVKATSVHPLSDMKTLSGVRTIEESSVSEIACKSLLRLTMFR